MASLKVDVTMPTPSASPSNESMGRISAAGRVVGVRPLYPCELCLEAKDRRPSHSMIRRHGVVDLVKGLRVVRMLAAPRGVSHHVFMHDSLGRRKARNDKAR